MIIPDDILMINDSSHGGAASSTRRMVRVLSRYSKSFKQRYFSPPLQGELTCASSLDPRRKRPPLERLMKNFSRDLAKRLMKSRHERLLFRELEEVQPKLINLRNIHDCGIDHESLLKIDRDIPLVWTMHDCWPYRPYAFEFKNSKAGSQEFALGYKDSYRAVEVRNHFFDSRRDIVLVSPSEWLAKDARVTFPKVNVEHIPNGVCLESFCPIDKTTAKNVLGLDENMTWLGFASTWANSRKGLDVLVDALATLGNLKGVGFVAWGGSFSGQWPSHVPLCHFGRIENEAFSRLLYSAIDLFVCPSRADNLPNTCLEALACGTPVLGSSAGGIPEMAVEGETGWVFENDSPMSLATKLSEALDEKSQWTRLADSGVQLVHEKYDVNKTAAKYAELFCRLAEN